MAYVYGSWAARLTGVEGRRPVQITIREADWLATGVGSFHDTVVSRPMVPIQLDDPESIR
jgi:hypothetical protein